MSPRNSALNEKMRAEALEKLAKAALRVFADYGYHGATMKKIMDATDLSYGLVYHYFPSKDAIFRFLIDTSFNASQAGVRMFMASPGSAWERIVRLSDFLIREAVSGDSAAYFLIVLHGMTQTSDIPGFQEHVTRRTEEYYQALAPCIKEAQDAGEAAAGDPYLLAAAYFSFLQGLALLGVQKNDLRKHIGSDMVLRVLRDGARKN